MVSFLTFALLPAVGGSYRAIFWLASLPAALCVLVLAATVREVSPQGASARLPLLWAALHVVKSTTSLGGGILSDRIGRRGTIAAGWLVYACVYAGFALVVSAWQIWGLFLVYGLYFGLTEGVEKALVADLVPAELRASAFGIYHTAIGIVALPASLLTGWLWQVFGVGPAFGTGAAQAAGAAILLMAVLNGPDPKPRAAG